MRRRRARQPAARVYKLKQGGLQLLLPLLLLLLLLLRLLLCLLLAGGCGLLLSGSFLSFAVCSRAILLPAACRCPGGASGAAGAQHGRRRAALVLLLLQRRSKTCLVQRELLPQHSCRHALHLVKCLRRCLGGRILSWVFQPLQLGRGRRGLAGRLPRLLLLRLLLLCLLLLLLLLRLQLRLRLLLRQLG